MSKLQNDVWDYLCATNERMRFLKILSREGWFALSTSNDDLIVRLRHHILIHRNEFCEAGVRRFEKRFFEKEDAYAYVLVCIQGKGLDGYTLSEATSRMIDAARNTEGVGTSGTGWIYKIDPGKYISSYDLLNEKPLDLKKNRS